MSVKVETLPSEPKEIKSKTTLNLGNLLKPAVPKVSKEEKAIEVINDSAVNIEQLREFWTRYAELHKTNVAEYHLLNRGFELEGNMITIHLNNAIEEPLLQSIKIDLLTYLRDRLKNNNLQLTAKLKEVISNRVAYTNKEKFEAMVEKNPLLIQLKDKFGLDPDF